MRKPRPFQWIEEAEARQVVMIALSEAPQSPRPVRATDHWAMRIRRWAFFAPAERIAEVELDPAGIAPPTAEL